MFTTLILKRTVVKAAAVCDGAINKQCIGQKLLTPDRSCFYFNVKVAVLMSIFPGSQPTC